MSLAVQLAFCVFNCFSFILFLSKLNDDDDDDSCLLQSAGGEANRILKASALSSMRIICPNRVSRHDWIIAVVWVASLASVRRHSVQIGTI